MGLAHLHTTSPQRIKGMDAVVHSKTAERTGTIVEQTIKEYFQLEIGQGKGVRIPNA